MRCRACNNEMEVIWMMPDVGPGEDPVGPLLETCCPKCLMAADIFSGGDEDLDEVLEEVGVHHGHSYSTE